MNDTENAIRLRIQSLEAKILAAKVEVRVQELTLSLMQGYLKCGTMSVVLVGGEKLTDKPNVTGVPGWDASNVYSKARQMAQLAMGV